jgi:hypothetical protein
MSDVRFLAPLMSALRSLPLWIFVALAAAGYAALFAPAFGGIELASFRKQWGAWFWLDATTFSIFAVVCAADKAVAYWKVRKKREKTLVSNRYYKLYAPLFAEIMKIHVTTARGCGAPRFRQRLENSWECLFEIRKRIPAIKAAWRALFDRKFLEVTGEVEYGDSFPIGRLRQIINVNLTCCDNRLIELIRLSERTRIEEQVADNYLTQQDIDLYKYIESEHAWLKKLLN